MLSFVIFAKEAPKFCNILAQNTLNSLRRASQSAPFGQILPQRYFFLPDFTPEGPSFCRILLQKDCLLVRVYLRRSFFLSVFTSEPPNFCQILPQNSLVSVSFPQNPLIQVRLHLRTPFSQFSRSVTSNSLRPQGLQHARPPCPSPIPGVCSNSCPSSRWCHPTISSSVIPFSSRLKSFPASGSFQMSQFFASGGQSIGVSASVSALPMNIQGLFASGWTGLISLQSKGLPGAFSNTTVKSTNSLVLSFLYSPTLTPIHDY